MERLSASPWIDSPQTLAVIDALEAAGGADCARFVGGCVRNGVIGAPVDDIDIATTLTPEAVTRALEAAGLRAVATGIAHGTVTAISKGRPYEITTLRRDVETDGRHAVVAFTTDWAEDARRRDFTLNALYADRDGTILDPTGRGLADARAGRIVFVGAPDDRIREDHLRILRFFRFLAWYGRGAPDEGALVACAAARDQIATLAAERITKEWLKLLAAPNPRPAVALMAQTRVLERVAPGPVDLARFAAMVRIERELGEAQPVLRLAALAPDDAGDAAAVLAPLRLSNAERDRVAAALAAEPVLAAEMTPQAARRAIYAAGRAVFRDRAKLAWARSPDEDAQWKALVALAEAWTVPAFPLGGEDAMAAGAPKGPKVGEALRQAEAWWIENDFPNDRAAVLAALGAAVRAVEE